MVRPAPRLDVIKFCEDPRLLNFRPWPVQEVILRAQFGLEMPERLLPLWKEIVLPRGIPYRPRWYTQLVLAIGRRGGKTRITRAAKAYEAIEHNPAQYVPASEHCILPIVATSQGIARDVFVATALRELKQSKALRAQIVWDDYKVRHGREVTNRDQIVFKNRTILRAFPCTSTAVLGYEGASPTYDEIAKYSLETSSPRGDLEVMRNLQPVTLNLTNRGVSQVSMISSVRAKEGQFFEAVSKAEQRIDWQLTILCPSWVANPNWNWDVMRQEQERDPLGFSMEYGSEFAEQVEGLFTVEQINRALVDRGPLLPIPGVVYWGRVDPAFVGDNFGLGVGHAEGETTRIDALEAIEPPKKGAISVEKVLDRWEALHKQYRVRKWRIDQYAGEVLAQAARARGIPVDVEPWSQGYKKTIYSTLTSQMRSGHFEAAEHPILRRELLRLQQRTTKSGQVSIGHPPGRGETDDLADVSAGLSHDCATGRRTGKRRKWNSRAIR